MIHVKPESKDGESYIVNVPGGCPRCGGAHAGLQVLPLERDADEFTHFAICPTLGHPIMSFIEKREDGVAISMPGGKPEAKRLAVVASVVQDVDIADIEPGKYPGTWGGYGVTFRVGHRTYRGKTLVGVRTPSLPVTVEVVDGQIFVEER